MSTTLKNVNKYEQFVAFGTVYVPVLAFPLALLVLFQKGITWTDLSLLAAGYALTVFGVSVGLHRHFTHRSFQAVSWLRAILGILGCMAAQGPIVFWAACHRTHHQFSDHEHDPHSPHSPYGEDSWILKRWWHAHIGWMFDHKPESRRIVPDLVRDPLVRWLDQNYFLWIAVGLLVPGIIGFAIERRWEAFLTGMLWGGIVRIFLVQHTTWGVNSYLHLSGSRGYETSDHSHNSPIMAFLTMGEGWHNNHHAFPYSARFGIEWWQIDTGYIALVALNYCGLVWGIKRPKFDGGEHHHSIVAANADEPNAVVEN